MTTTRSGPLRVVVVDDHPLIREGLKARIEREEDLIVCGEADDVVEALQVIKSTNPDVVVVDISLKTGNGLDLVQRLRPQYPSTAILVSSMHDENIYAERAMQAGAMGYIHKQEAADNLIDAIRQILDGRLYASDTVVQRILNRRVGKQDSDSPVRKLTPRELDVLERIGRGDSTRSIARDMKLSPKTIETYRDRIRKKLEIKSAHELQHYAFRFVNEHNE